MSFKLSVGKVGIARVPMYTNEAIAHLPVRDDSQLDGEYLLRAIQTLDLAGRVDRAAMGATLNMPKLNAIRIPVPPIEEQRRIAAVLDKADELRAKRRAALALLDTLTESIFVVGIGSAELSVDLGGHLVFLTSGARGWATYYSDRGSRFVRSLDVRMNAIGEESAVFVVAPDSAEARRIKVRASDVLLTITGSRIGRVATAPTELDGAFISQHVAILRLDSSALMPEYVARYLSLRSGGQRQIEAAQYGQTKPGLNFDQVRRFRIPALSISDQRLLVDRVGAAEATRVGTSSSLALLDELFASLQQRAFRGEL